MPTPNGKFGKKIVETIGEEATVDFYDAWLQNHVQNHLPFRQK
jgi:hypothetical protein